MTITIVLITNSLNYQLQISHPSYYVFEEKANSLVFEKDPFSPICNFREIKNLLKWRIFSWTGKIGSGKNTKYFFPTGLEVHPKDMF